VNRSDESNESRSCITTVLKDIKTQTGDTRLLMIIKVDIQHEKGESTIKSPPLFEDSQV
jgi:hypothetical protein